MKQTTGCFDYRDIRYRYRAWLPEVACDGAPMVLVHGFSQSSETWQEVAPLFAQRRPVYALDLVGHGGSQVPNQAAPYLLARQAEALLAFVRSVTEGHIKCHIVETEGAEAAGAGASEGKGAGAKSSSAGAGVSEGKGASKKAIAVGYSLGGRVLVEAACLQPQEFAREISAAILESAGLGQATEQDVAAAAEKDHACAQRLRESGLAAFMNWWERQPVFATQSDLDETLRSQLRADRLANDEEALARTFEYAGQHCMPLRAEVITAGQRLLRSGVRLGYVTGQRDKKYRMLARMIRQNEDFAKMKSVIVSGVGHNVHLEDPRAFVDVVEDMLA